MQTPRAWPCVTPKAAGIKIWKGIPKKETYISHHMMSQSAIKGGKRKKRGRVGSRCEMKHVKNVKIRKNKAYGGHESPGSPVNKYSAFVCTLVI